MKLNLGIKNELKFVYSHYFLSLFYFFSTIVSWASIHAPDFFIVTGPGGLRQIKHVARIISESIMLQILPLLLVHGVWVCPGHGWFRLTQQRDVGMEYVRLDVLFPLSNQTHT